MEKTSALKQIEIKLFEYFNHQAKSEHKQRVGGFVDEDEEHKKVA
jgi:hypothetical protein